VSPKFDQQKLELSLAKSLIGCRLREILANAGVPANKAVTLHIKQGEETILSREIPINLNVAFAQTQNDFEEEIIAFFDKAEASFGLLSALHNFDPHSEESTRIPIEFTFDIGSPKSGKPPNLQYRLAGCTICNDPPPLHLCCDD
jgi:hypothetical protein